MDLAQTPARLRGKPSWLIGKAAARGQRLIGEALTGVAGRGYHFAILAAVEEFGPESQVRIGQRCGIDQRDMHAMVKELAEQGHVTSSVDRADRRRNLIVLTSRGRRRLEELDGLLLGVQDDLLAELTATERSRLAELLSRVLG